MPKFKIGLDIHGVIDRSPVFFSDLTHRLFDISEIHIITGGSSGRELARLEDFNIKFHKFFSIPDYHAGIGTDIMYDHKGGVFMEDLIWDRTKGHYCRREGITIMVDDTVRYSLYMPDFTHFYHYSK